MVNELRKQANSQGRLGIDDVVALTGIPDVTLRNWEKRYGFPSPDRLPNGYRAYSSDQVVILKQLAQLMRNGHRIGVLIKGLRSGAALPSPAAEPVSSWHQDALVQLGSALFAFDQQEADRILGYLAASMPPEKLLDDVYLPLFRNIGEGWANGTVSVAQEHYATSYLRLHLAPLLTMPNGARNADLSAVCATVPGELHEGALMLLTAQLRLRGWQTYYLGASVPVDDLDIVMRQTKAGILCMSFSDHRVLQALLPRIRDIRYPVVIGGRGASHHAQSLRELPHVTVSSGVGVNAVDEVELALKTARFGR